jgi:hypothetical protein
MISAIDSAIAAALARRPVRADVRVLVVTGEVMAVTHVTMPIAPPSS